MNNYDLAKEIRESKLKTHPKVKLKTSLNNINNNKNSLVEKKVSISEKSNEDSIFSDVEEKEKKDEKKEQKSLNIDENFSFGKNKSQKDKNEINEKSTKKEKKNVIISQNTKNTKKEEKDINKDDTILYSNKDSSNMTNSLKKEESENDNFENSNIQIIDNSNSESLNNKDGNDEKDNNPILSFKDKSKELIKNNENENELMSLYSYKTNKSKDKDTNKDINTTENISNLINGKNPQQMNFNNMFISNENNKPKKPIEYAYLKDLTLNQKFIINIKINDKNIDKNNKNETCERKSIDSGMFNKLREINLSLDNEKAYSNFFKKLDKENTSRNTYKEKINNHFANIKYNTKSKKSTNSQEMTSGSTNSNLDNFYYPDVYYINEENNLHTKTHISMLFEKLKNRNNS